MNTPAHQHGFEILQTARATGKALSPEQAHAVAALPASATLDILATAKIVLGGYEKAGATAPSPMRTCGIVNAKSGRCSENCAFCAQSRHHAANAPVYPLLSTEALLEQALRLADAGAQRYGIVTSGHALSKRELEALCQAVRVLCERTTLNICASLGQLTEADAIMLKEAGVSRYHHNLETARSFFPSICTTHEYDEDIHTVQVALKAGLSVCSGGILGMGESWEQRIELAETLRGLAVHSVPINFLTPIKGTRLENRQPLPPFEALKCIALFRLMLPERDILIAGGRENTLREYQSWLFMAGANGMMIGNYLTTSGRSIADDREMMRDMGLLT